MSPRPRSRPQFAAERPRARGAATTEQQIGTTIRSILELRTALRLIPAMAAALAPAQCAVLRSIHSNVCQAPGIPALSSRIDALLDDDVCGGRAAFAAKARQVFAVRGGADCYLDMGAPPRRTPREKPNGPPHLLRHLLRGYCPCAPLSPPRAALTFHTRTPLLWPAPQPAPPSPAPDAALNPSSPTACPLRSPKGVLRGDGGDPRPQGRPRCGDGAADKGAPRGG